VNIWLLCCAVLVLLYFALSVNVSRLRGQTKTGIGTGDDPSGPLNKAVRAHGNAAEYTPLFVALFLYFSLSGWGGWVVWVALILTICRVLHALGMIMTSSFRGPPHPLRLIGGAGTYLGGFVLGVALLVRAFV
jgi:uncharacterized membrane protein YecN with MAPEG domain